jgi:hypothetical protein
MKRTSKRVRTRFSAQTRFDVATIPVVSFRELQETELEGLKTRLLREHLNQEENSELHASLRRAANESAALAWMSGYPLLVLPLLLEEMAQAARSQYVRQEGIRRRSQDLLTELVG